MSCPTSLGLDGFVTAVRVLSGEIAWLNHFKSPFNTKIFLLSLEEAEDGS